MRVLFVVRYSGEEYLGIRGISSLLKEHGHCVEIVEAEYERVKKKLEINIPTILAYSTPTALVNYYLNLNKRIKENFRVFSSFGGPHPTAVPEMIQEDGVDGVCIGEGEFAMLELVEKIDSGSPLKNIRNWWIKEDSIIYKNSLRPLVRNLDSLPFPDSELFRNQNLFDSEKIHILTGRGCPYFCSYCCQPSYNRIYFPQAEKIRKRSVGNVIEEITRLKKKFPVKFVMFEDDIFTLPFEWLREFTSQYKKFINLPFFCYVRADLIDSKIAGELKSAGCFSLSMGVETADDYLRNSILKKNISREQIIDAARIIKEHKIRLKTSNIIGIPGGCLDSDLETIRLNIECKADFSSVSALIIYPQTEIDTIFAKNESGGRRYYQTHVNANLCELFALAVEYKFLLIFIKFLVRLPLNGLYRLFNLFWEGYCAYFRLYPAGIKTFIRGIRKYVFILDNQFKKDKT